MCWGRSKRAPLSAQRSDRCDEHWLGRCIDEPRRNTVALKSSAAVARGGASSCECWFRGCGRQTLLEQTELESWELEKFFGEVRKTVEEGSWQRRTPPAGDSVSSGWVLTRTAPAILCWNSRYRHSFSTSSDDAFKVHVAFSGQAMMQRRILLFAMVF